MQREAILEMHGHALLDAASQLFGMDRGTLRLVPGHEGCANLVYECRRDGQPFMLRISFRPDRTAAQIQAELHFVNYLAAHGVRVSAPVPSRRGKLLETLQLEGIPLYLVSFVRGKGMRIPDNGYRYREDAPIEGYFENWGQVLGRMHALAKDYHPASGRPPRGAL